MVLKLENINKSFGEKQIFNNANFTFEKGKIYGLLGRNGAGKTTLFNCISGDLKLDSGNIYLNENIENTPLSADNVGMVYSTPILPDFLTGYEFIKFYIDINKDKVDDIKTIDEYFDIVKLEKEDRYKLIKSYSHGMKNKLQMLCFIISKPPVILLDEPLTSFDVVVALEMKKLLKELKHEHIIIFSTHILQLATDLCDEVVILHQHILTETNQEILHSEEFETQLVEILKDE